MYYNIIIQDNVTKYFINQNYQPSNSESKPIIKCTGSKCIALDNPNSNSANNVYYIDGYSKKNIISCNKDGCITEDKCANLNYDIYFLDNDNSKNIITCNKINGCKTEEAKQGIYIQNMNNEDYTNNIIKCNSKGCANFKVNNACAEENDIGNVFIDYNINVCLTPNADSTQAVWKTFLLDDYSKYILSKKVSSKLFDNISGEYAFIVTTASSIIYDESK